MADALITKFRRLVSDEYMYAGVCRWVQGRRKQAAEIWRDGLTCSYTSYCGIDCALLLWYGGTRAHSIGNIDDVIARIKKPHLADLRTGYFEDALVRFMFGAIDESTARNLATNEPRDYYVAQNVLRLHFYAAALDARLRNWRRFRQRMVECAAANGVKFVVPELVIARFEAGQLPFQKRTPKSTRGT
jgi:hypothetical protein